MRMPEFGACSGTYCAPPRPPYPEWWSMQNRLNRYSNCAMLPNGSPNGADNIASGQSVSHSCPATAIMQLPSLSSRLGASRWQHHASLHKWKRLHKPPQSAKRKAKPNSAASAGCFFETAQPSYQYSKRAGHPHHGCYQQMAVAQ